MRKVPQTVAQNLKPKPEDETALSFGAIFTDHMLLSDYAEGEGWHGMRIEPYRPFEMDPACAVLHYGQSIFEGLKCYRGANGCLRLFRARDNFGRLNVSARRMSIPPLDVDECMNGLLSLLALEADWVPGADGASLYIRPTIIATDNRLTVNASDTYCFFIILSPSGPYYPGGLSPVSIYVEDEYVRAVRGGIGFTKASANYAASLFAATIAHHKGYSQVLWLDGIEQKYIEEVGAMNIAFVFGETIVTPALSGSILSGITRDSILRIARDAGYAVEERKISVDEVVGGIRSGALTEAFGTGTAAVVSPVGSLCYHGEAMTVGDGGVGGVTRRMYDTLVGIQKGDLPDPYGWTMEIK